MDKTELARGPIVHITSHHGRSHFTVTIRSRGEWKLPISQLQFAREAYDTQRDVSVVAFTDSLTLSWAPVEHILSEGTIATIYLSTSRVALRGVSLGNAWYISNMQNALDIVARNPATDVEIVEIQDHDRRVTVLRVKSPAPR